MILRRYSASRETGAGAVGPGSRPIAWLLACAAALAIAIAAATTVTILSLRERALRNTERELRNTALMVAAQFDRVFETAEQLQSSLIERFAARGAMTLESFERELSGHDVHLMLKDKIVGLPYLGTFTLANAKGKVFNFSRSWPIPDISVADRDFFLALRDNPDLTSYVSRPIVNRATNTWVVHFARKLTGPRKEFVGLLSAVVELSVVEKFFSRITLGQDSAVFLVNQDGELLARYPQAPDLVSQTVLPASILQAVSNGASSFARRFGVDGEDRVMAFRGLARYPFVVGASTGAEAVFVGWWREAIFLGATATLAIILIATLTALIVRKLHQGNRQVRMTLAEQKFRLDTALDHMHQGLSIFDARGRLVLCNKRYGDMYGVPTEKTRPGCMLRDVLAARKAAGTFSGDPDEHAAAMSAAMLAGKSTSRLADLPDGRSIQVVNQPTPDGGWVSTHEDVTEQKKAERERNRSRKLLDLVVENVPTAIFLRHARDKRYVLVNRAAEKIWEVSRDKLIGRTAAEVFPADYARKVAERDDELLASKAALFFNEHELRTHRGTTRVVTSRLHLVQGDDDPNQYVLGVVEDITEQKRADQRIAHMARHNSLTDLPNRVAFRERLEEAVKWCHKDEHVAVLCIDLDDLKSVNDMLGHSFGDNLLKAVAGRLKTCLPEGTTIAHLGADDFAIIQTGVRQIDDVTELAKRTCEWIRTPYDLDGHNLTLTASIGIAMAPDDGTDPDQLLKDAGLALHRAKAEGQHAYRFFEAGMDERMQTRRALELDMRNAIANDEFELFYQPLVDLKTGAIKGCEALLRWRHPQRGMISPLDFIPVAEETGLIDVIGEWTLRKACSDAAGWSEELSVAVNLSPVQFRKPTLALNVINALSESGLMPHRLELEVTESVLMENNDSTLAMLHQLQNLGVRIAMDDFGTGYSSLSYLRSFPFNKIKIDRSFVADLSQREDAFVIVQAIADLARNLNMTTTAEGVETEQQRDMVRNAGCTEMQGYLVSKPRSLAELRPVLAPARKVG